MSQPWLSVITPVYNGEAYLSSALDSILIQEIEDIECLAVNGASTDTTQLILESYQHRLPLKILQKEKESNWVNKTNYALSQARGEYVCFLHHDDLWFKDRLKIMRKMTHRFPQAVILLHPSEFIDIRGNHVGLWNCPLPHSPKIITSRLMTERLLAQNFISILGPIFKREVALKVGGLDEDLWYTADWDFWLKIAACGDAIYYPKPLSGFRIHTGSQTVVRSSYIEDFHGQLERVAKKHLSSWDAPNTLKRKVEKIADFSIMVNTALAGVLHGGKISFYKLVASFLGLGPFGQYRYLRNSRIWQRVTARLRSQLMGRHQAR